MEITFLGRSALRLRGREVTVIIDPLDHRPGMPKVRTDIVVRTEGATEPARLRRVDGRAQEIAGPGEFEIRGVTVLGLPAGAVTVMLVEIDEVRVVSVGRLARQLSVDEIERLGHVDVLAVPVGGADALAAADAARLVRAIEPAIVVPVRHRVEGLDAEHAPLDAFAKEMGLAEGTQAQPKLNLTGSIAGSEDTRVVVLEPRIAVGT